MCQQTSVRLSNIKFHENLFSHSRLLGGVAVSVLATGPKGHGFESGQGDGFLRAMKVCSTPSFGWEVKSEILS
jgi:hypothetical protein